MACACILPKYMCTAGLADLAGLHAAWITCHTKADDKHLIDQLNPSRYRNLVPAGVEHA